MSGGRGLVGMLVYFQLVVKPEFVELSDLPCASFLHLRKEICHSHRCEYTDLELSASVDQVIQAWGMQLTWHFLSACTSTSGIYSLSPPQISLSNPLSNKHHAQNRLFPLPTLHHRLTHQHHTRQRIRNPNLWRKP